MTATEAERSAAPARAFPAGFLWGAGDRRVPDRGRRRREDGRGTSIWDTFSHTPGGSAAATPATSPATSTTAGQRDLDLLGAIGLNAFRFSVAWPRVQPSGSGAVNQRGLDFYRALVERAARARDHARDHALPLGPAAGARGRGRLGARDTALRFAEYAAIVALGARRHRRDLDDDQRAPGRRAPGIPHRHACAGPLRRRARRGRDPPPAASGTGSRCAALRAALPAGARSGSRWTSTRSARGGRARRRRSGSATPRRTGSSSSRSCTAAIRRPRGSTCCRRRADQRGDMELIARPAGLPRGQLLLAPLRQGAGVAGARAWQAPGAPPRGRLPAGALRAHVDGLADRAERPLRHPAHAGRRDGARPAALRHRERLCRRGLRQPGGHASRIWSASTTCTRISRRPGGHAATASRWPATSTGRCWTTSSGRGATRSASGWCSWSSTPSGAFPSEAPSTTPASPRRTPSRRRRSATRPRDRPPHRRWRSRSGRSALRSGAAGSHRPICAARGRIRDNP